MSAVAAGATAAVVVAVAAIAMGAAPLHAQESAAPAQAVLPAGPLTLQQAIAIAEQRGQAAVSATATRDAARARNRAFKDRLLPQISLGGQLFDLNRGITPLLLASGQTQLVTQAQNESSIGLTLSQAIPWTGGQLSISSQLTRIDNFGTATGVAPRVWTTTPLLIGLQQDLFRPRTLMWQSREEAVSSSLASQQYLEAREDVAAGVASAFFDYYAAQVDLNNARTNVAVNDTLYTLNKGRYSVGKIGENDLLQSELALLRARASLDAAKLERDRTEAALRRLLQVHPADTLRIAPPAMLAPFDVDPDVAVAQALANSSVIEQNQLNDLQARETANQASLANHFNATVSAVVGFNQSATVLGQAYQSPLARQQLTVGVTMPLLQWGAGSDEAQAAKLDVERVGADAAARRDQLQENARFAALQFVQSQRNVAISAKADTVAQKRFEVAKDRYVIGKIGINDLYIGLNEKDQALQAYIQALRQYWSTYYQLRRVTLYDFAEGQPIR
jgi:outer membrane protein TolC